MATIPEEVTNIVSRLPQDKQQQVLDYVRSVEQALIATPSPLPPGTPFEKLRAFKPTISREAAEEMERAIEEGCETIEPDDDKLFA
jgi:hypothetical protein